MNSLLSFSVGTKCSVIIEVNGNFFRRNGVVNSNIQHLHGCWCVELTQRCEGEPYFVKAYEKHFEILEPMNGFEMIEGAFDELAVH